MFKIVCVTDRKSCCEDFLTRIEKIADAKPDIIMFRDKESSDEDYVETAFKILKISKKYGIPCIMYRHPEIFGGIHMTMPTLRTTSQQDMQCQEIIGASVHSAAEAAEAEQWGVDYLIAGHIFETSCKPGLAPRGTEFLHEVCKSVSIPVYAIGGITPGNVEQVARAGASGACIMSGLMTCGDPAEYILSLRKGAEII